MVTNHKVIKRHLGDMSEKLRKSFILVSERISMKKEKIAYVNENGGIGTAIAEGFTSD